MEALLGAVAVLWSLWVIGLTVYGLIVLAKKLIKWAKMKLTPRTLDLGSQPPIHYNCRSTLIPIFEDRPPKWAAKIDAEFNDYFNRREPEMKLDTDAIKKRFENAVVVGVHGGKIAILLPMSPNGYINIVTGFYWDSPTNYLGTNKADWTVRKGDKCETGLSDKVTFLGFSGLASSPFRVMYKDGSRACIDTIRPVPRLTERQKRIQNIKNELAELEKLELE